jgi:hypothetical protein
MHPMLHRFDGCESRSPYSGMWHTADLSASDASKTRLHGVKDAGARYSHRVEQNTKRNGTQRHVVNTSSHKLGALHTSGSFRKATRSLCEIRQWVQIATTMVPECTVILQLLTLRSFFDLAIAKAACSISGQETTNA